MDTRTKEAIRYLGYGRHAVDEKTLLLVEECFQTLNQIASPKIIYRIFDVVPQENENLAIGGIEISSGNLYKNLTGCEQAVILGATLGVSVDIEIRRARFTNMAQAVVLQACAAALLEEYLEERQEEIRCEMEAKERYLRPRFSPGYGDFSISHQRKILQILDAAKKIGLTMTDSYMLTPTKSVTAVIGISTIKAPCHKHGCEECEKADCTYRRNEEL